MNWKFLTRLVRMAWTVSLLVPVLVLAQTPNDDIGTAGDINNRDAAVDVDSSPVDEKSWRFRFDLSWVDPSGDFVPSTPGGTALRAGFDTGFGAGLRFEYLFSSRFGVEAGVLSAGTVDLASGFYGGTIRNNVEVSGFVPVTVGINIHLTPDHPVDLYIGPQLALVQYSSVDVWTTHGRAGTAVSIDNDIGWGVILGLDVPLGSRGWMVQANLRYIDTDMKNSGKDIAVDSEFDPVIFSLGFGYRF